MTHLVARTFRGPEGTPPPGWQLPAQGGAIWVGVYDDTDTDTHTQLAAARAQTGTLGGEAFAAALVAAAAAVGYTATSSIRTAADGEECEFDVEPAGAPSGG